MAESYRALAPEHRALLVALLDQPPGPGGRARARSPTARRHAPEGLSHARRSTCSTGSPTTSCASCRRRASTWVHPSWRDLVIDELAADADGAPRLPPALLGRRPAARALARRRRGRATRSLPLLVDDADWDAAAERIHELVPELDDADLLRLLTSLDVGVRTGRRAHGRRAARARVDGARPPRRRAGGRAAALPSAEVLGKWLDLAARLPEPPASLDVRAPLAARRPAGRDAAHRRARPSSTCAGCDSRRR